MNSNSKNWSKTIRGRSPVFQAYLNQQTPERRAGLVVAEGAYLKTKISAPGDKNIEIAHERDYVESMIGYEDIPAGTDRPGVLDTPLNA